ncbi:MAG: YebC/PmpR family DNA-binding transcriptional regulator [Planctomycetota bacterium]
MSGHSHWATIKHKKGAADARKGKMFSKISKLLMQAARDGGTDPGSNIKLQLAIDKARAENMPKDNIERAIKRGSGEMGDVKFEELTYEGYGPGGVAIMVKVLTDNKNRTVSEVRKIFENKGGNLGTANSVAYNFQRKGTLAVTGEGLKEDDVMTVALDAGAEDVETTDDAFIITTSAEDYTAVKKVLEAKGWTLSMSEIGLVPKTLTEVDGAIGKRVLDLIDGLEDHDDVQDVYSNVSMPQEDTPKGGAPGAAVAK